MGNNLRVVQGPLTIAGNVIFSGRTLVITASALWSNNVAGAIQLANNAVVTNAPNAVFECVGGGIIQKGPETNVFANYGLLLKHGPTNDTEIQPFFDNAGEVDVQSGTLKLSGGGEETGLFNISAKASLALTGGTHHFDVASVITGEGDFQVGGGEADLEGTFNLTGTHRYSFGTAHITGNYNAVNNALIIDGG